MAARTPVDFERFLDQCDNWIRTGHASLARSRLQKINFRKVPRHLLHRYCAAARRTQQWQLSLRALQPIVRPKSGHADDAFANEKIEYALSLWRTGAFKEAEGILREPKLKNEPRALLAKAHGHMHRWEYPEALALLDLFIKSPGISEYERVTGEVNRIACLGYLADDTFEHVYKELDSRLKKPGFSLLRANALEIRAQRQIMGGEYKAAKETILAGQSFAKADGGRSQFLLEKWAGLLEALVERAPEKLDALRQKALAISNWESIRDIDYFHAVLNPQSRWGNFAYYGTPHSAFRKKMHGLREFANEEWLSLTDKAQTRFDPWFVASGDGDLIHRFVVMLLRDFYRPVTPGEIFSLVYPDQYFDVGTAPGRVRQLVLRTKKWLKKNKVPARLEEVNGCYGLRLTPDGQLLCRRLVLQVEKSAFLFSRLTDKYGESLPTSSWAKILKKSEENTRRTLAQAIEDGCVKKHGRGQYTTYEIAPSGHAKDPAITAREMRP